MVLVASVVSNPSPKRKPIFDADFLKTGIFVKEEVQCKSQQANYIKQRDELLEKVKQIQHKIQALPCEEEKKQLKGNQVQSSSDFCTYLRNLLQSQVYDSYVLVFMTEQFNHICMFE